MTEYYLEKVNDTERQVKFAKVGYEAEIKALGAKLTNCTLEESATIIKEIEAATKAMKALEETHEYNLKNYRENGGMIDGSNKSASMLYTKKTK